MPPRERAALQVSPNPNPIPPTPPLTLTRCRPLGMFDAISTLAVSTTPAELYRTVLVDTPLGAPLGLGLGLGFPQGLPPKASPRASAEHAWGSCDGTPGSPVRSCQSGRVASSRPYTRSARESSSLHTAPLCLGVRGPGIAGLCNTRVV